MSATLMDTNPVPEPDLSASQPANPDAVISSPSLPAAIQRENPFLEIFAGPNGLYPATRWLIYLFIACAIGALLLTSLRALHPTGDKSVWWMMAAQAIVAIVALAAGWVMSKIEDRPFGDFGLPLRNAFRGNFWVGIVWGIVSLSALMMMLRLAGAFSFGSLALRGIDLLKFAIFYAVFFLFTGFFEEFAFRGYSQWILAKGMHFWPAAALLSIGFGALHGFNPGEAKIGLFAAMLIAFFFCLTLRRTGDLWWAVGFHASWDWGESYLYSVPDSGGMMTGHMLNSSFHGPAWLTGGSVGPEGSALVFVVIAATWVLFDRMYPDVKYSS